MSETESTPPVLPRTADLASGDKTLHLALGADQIPEMWVTTKTVERAAVAELVVADNRYAARLKEPYGEKGVEMVAISKALFSQAQGWISDISAAATKDAAGNELDHVWEWSESNPEEIQRGVFIREELTRREIPVMEDFDAELPFSAATTTAAYEEMNARVEERLEEMSPENQATEDFDGPTMLADPCDICGVSPSYRVRDGGVRCHRHL